MSGVTTYDLPPIARSHLLKDLPVAIPSNPELEVLIAELKFVKQKANERAKKANEDLRTIEESLRRLKEKEKGKGKAIEKSKRDRGCTCTCDILCGPTNCSLFVGHLVTPLSNGGNDRLSAQPMNLLKSRLPIVSVNGSQSRIASPPFDPRKAYAPRLTKS